MTTTLRDRVQSLADQYAVAETDSVQARRVLEIVRQDLFDAIGSEGNADGDRSD